MKASDMVLETKGRHREGATVQGDKWRITVLTEELLRLEYSEDGSFEDHPTQRVINRDFPVPGFQVREGEEELQVITPKVHLTYDKRPFSPNGLEIRIRGNGCASVWHYGEAVRDLKGTARTLDEARGEIPLEPGLLSRNGITVLDDSGTITLLEEGWVRQRSQEAVDLYFFGYGHAYEKCLRDFYHLCGHTPLLPRFVFGNWWSRYHKYTEQEYKDLVGRFEEEGIPLSVAVIDMDWHLVDIDPKYGDGWTGYTWNREFFPDPEGFMGWLHDHGLKVSLNVHPADGVRGFEEPYKEMAKALGRDWEKEEPIPFDLTNRAFVDAYFQYLHHPYEKQGVDFWWLDWQQGGVTRIPGLDPLWMLNHYHYLDSKRDGGRGLTFSRYAGIGSHRYPVGFSGDTYMCWESLAFQPYFTANASNVGYGWGSHDIGGHMAGYKDEELITRWIQFGVFSPILRLHSSSNEFLHKEPWYFGEPYQGVVKKYLRLRHELIPYLYTMNLYASREGRPLVRPMYYLAPEKEEAYQVPNEYWFGTEMVACPITEPADKTGYASVRAWLPEGKWFDIFNGRIYQGGRRIPLYRQISHMPVLAKAGGIIPMAKEPGEGMENPGSLRVKIFAGADGSFHLYEDAGQGEEDLLRGWADTYMAFDWQGGSFTINGAQGEKDALPRERGWELEFYGIEAPGEVSVAVGGRETEVVQKYQKERQVHVIQIPPVETGAEIKVTFGTPLSVKENDLEAQIYELLTRLNMDNNPKEAIFRLLQEKKELKALLSDLQNMDLEGTVYGAASEILLA